MKTILITFALVAATTSAVAFERGEYGGCHGEGPAYDHASNSAREEGTSDARSISLPPPDNGMTDVDYEAAYDDPSVDPEIDGNYPDTTANACSSGCDVPDDVEKASNVDLHPADTVSSRLRD
jgi:hypothetical protein